MPTKAQQQLVLVKAAADALVVELKKMKRVYRRADGVDLDGIIDDVENVKFDLEEDLAPRSF